MAMAGKRMRWIDKNCPAVSLALKMGRRLFAAAAIGALLLAGCAAPKAYLDRSAEGKIVWPGPPEKARVKFMWSISKLATNGQGKRGLADFLAGNASGDVTDPRTSDVLMRPFGLFVDQKRRLYVADPGASRVTVIDLNEGATFNIFEGGPEELQNPVAVAADPAGRIYVSDSGLKKVLVYDEKGKFLFAFRGEFQRPTGLAIDPGSSTVYVADTPADTIYRYTTQGERVGSIGRRGGLPGEFNFPTQLFVDALSRLYVTDAMNFRVQSFSADGKPLGAVGTLGDGTGNLDKPKGVAADSHGNIYVVDSIKDTVKIFNPGGELLLNFGEKGMQLGEFWLPAGIFIDDKNTIYLADPYNMRVQVFQLLE
jgi:DNA-binding beta-propeller fold protein YncE